MKQVGKRILSGILCAILAVSPLTSCETVIPPEGEKEKDVTQHEKDHHRAV